MTPFLAADDASFYRKAGRLVLEACVSAVEKRGRFSIALSGGSTPRKLYSLLAEPYYRDRIAWDKWNVFWGDERCVPPDDGESNYGAARAALLSRVPIPAPQVHRMQGEVRPATEAARAYERELRLFFRNDPVPRFDLILLGVGDDGHTASLFPGTSALTEKERWVTAPHVDRLGADRLSLTFPVINSARLILVLCAGDSKSSVVRDVFQSDGPVRFPIQRVAPTEGELVWLLDKPAASRLPATARFEAVHLEKGDIHA